MAIVGATLGKTAAVPDGLGDFHIQRSLAVFRPRENTVDSIWLLCVLRSAGFQSLLWEHAGYSAQPGIYLGTLGDFSIPMPPLAEQSDICRELGAHVKNLETLISLTQASIGLLTERRAALITAAVTGQIDVRAEQPASTLEPV